MRSVSIVVRYLVCDCTRYLDRCMSRPDCMVLVEISFRSKIKLEILEIDMT